MSGRISLVVVALLAATIGGAIGSSTGTVPLSVASTPSVPDAPRTTDRHRTAQNSIAIRGCAIRFDRRDASGRTRPRAYTNRMHSCVGVTRIYADRSGDLAIESDSHEPIVFISVSPDETLTARGIDCGASGGARVTTIRCYGRAGNRLKAYSSALFGRRANLWVGWFSWTR